MSCSVYYSIILSFYLLKRYNNDTSYETIHDSKLSVTTRTKINQSIELQLRWSISSIDELTALFFIASLCEYWLRILISSIKSQRSLSFDNFCTCTLNIKQRSYYAFKLLFKTRQQSFFLQHQSHFCIVI